MKKISLLLCFIGFVTGAFAKENPSIALEIGALGSKEIYSKQSYSPDSDVPFTFSPDIHLGFDFPIFDLRDNITFGIKAGYDFSFNTYVYDSDSSNQKTNKHAISLLPEFAFIKKNLSISIASGLCASFNFQSTKEVTYSSYSSGTSKNEQLTKEIVLQVFWISTLGVKYRLTNHIALIGDFSVSVAFLTTQLLHERSFSPSTYGTISYPTYIASGRYPLFISPKIGVCYTF